MRRDEIQRKLGITPLTGEADATFSGRMLCDISIEMLEELRVFMGLTEIGAPEGWNSREKVAVMLSYPILDDFTDWAARRKGWWVVIIHPAKNKVYVDAEEAAKYRESELSCSVLPPIGERTRNQHQMSGRLE